MLLSMTHVTECYCQDCPPVSSQPSHKPRNWLCRRFGYSLTPAVIQIPKRDLQHVMWSIIWRQACSKRSDGMLPSSPVTAAHQSPHNRAHFQASHLCMEGTLVTTFCTVTTNAQLECSQEPCAEGIDSCLESGMVSPTNPVIEAVLSFHAVA